MMDKILKELRNLQTVFGNTTQAHSQI